MNAVPTFQPIVWDPQRTIRDRLNSLYRNTRIEKRELAAKIFEIGLDVLERRVQKEQSPSK